MSSHADGRLVPVTSWANYLEQVANNVPNSKIAELAGVDVSQVSRWKSGSTVPAEKTVRQLALALERSQDEALVAAGHLKLPAHPPRSAPSGPPQSDPSSLRGGLRGYFYTAAKIRYFLPVLKRARIGILSLDWRDELTPQSPDSWGGDARLAEVDALAVADIQSLPYANWEPFRADWKTALDSWYLTTRTVIGEEYINHVRQALDQISDGDRLVGAYARADRLIETLTETIGPIDDKRDSNRVTYEMMYVGDRTALTASYLAGLAAGGHDIDWRSWYLNQAEAWSDAHPYKSRVQLTVSSPKLQSLPAYWTAQVKKNQLISPATDVVAAADLLPGDRLIGRQKFGRGREVLRCPEGWIVKTGAHMRDGIECIALEGKDLNLWNGTEYLPQTLFHVQRSAEH